MREGIGGCWSSFPPFVFIVTRNPRKSFKNILGKDKKMRTLEQENLNSKNLYLLNGKQRVEILKAIFKERNNYRNNFGFMYVVCRLTVEEQSTISFNLFYVDDTDKGYVWHFSHIREFIKMIVNDIRNFPIDCDCQYDSNKGCELCR